ncbi:SDR family oxidoreductase [Runella sp. MFBS21]|uniref:SDR family oxidoreductase n=1 Tax=Runella sp. MFBS21 TaxID=3034018 RepID=UPI0023FA148B|nr:SDR family oxidoreductase [Runella sp. MFBS21]MDF7820478.1 SDR family oxidoreductase [Runella sp. MFBS21]
MILVTGATGHLGSATIDFLLETTPSTQIAALVRDVAKAGNLTEKGVEVRQGDYSDIDSLSKAFEGIDTLLLISSSSMENRFLQHTNAIDAAKKAGVKYIVYTSVVKPSYETKFLPGLDHIKTEEYLKASGLNYVIFRNTFYAEVLPMLLGNALETGDWYYPVGDAKINLVARFDIAEGLAKVLVAPEKHLNQVYEITSGESLSFTQIAALLTEAKGKTITYTSIPTEAFVGGLQQAGLPEPVIGMIGGIAEAIKDGELSTTDAALENILGRKTTPLKSCIELL